MVPIRKVSSNVSIVGIECLGCGAGDRVGRDAYRRLFGTRRAGKSDRSSCESPRIRKARLYSGELHGPLPGELPTPRENAARYALRVTSEREACRWLPKTKTFFVKTHF